MSIFDLETAVLEAVKGLERFSDVGVAAENLAAALTDARRSESERRRLLRLAGILTDRAYVGPAVVHLDVVGVCNLNCIYCRDHSPYLRGRDAWRDMEMPLHRLQRFVREGISIGAEQFPILGSGEPRLHTAWPEMIEFMIERDVDFEIFTNGTLLSDRDIEQLGRAKRLKLHFSISAATEKTYNAFRPEVGAGLLARIEEAIGRLRSLRGEREGPRLVIVHVLNSMNAHELRRMVDQAVRTGVDEVQLKLTEYEPYNDRIMLTAEQIQGLRSALPQFKADLAAHGITVHDNIDPQLDAIDPRSGLFCLDLYRRIGCFIGNDLVRIRRDGRVAFCCAMKWVGDLNRDTLAGHFFGPDMGRYRWVGKRCFAGWNTSLPNGDPLIARDCLRCFNYITNLHLHRDLERLGLWDAIRRSTLSQGGGRMVEPGDESLASMREALG